jgi:hypothetical protein
MFHCEKKVPILSQCVSSVQEDFFMELHSILAGKEEVTELHPVPDAHVPVMKFKFNGISIDLLYARLSLWAIPDVSVFCCLSIIRNMYFWGYCGQRRKSCAQLGHYQVCYSGMRFLSLQFMIELIEVALL